MIIFRFETNTEAAWGIVLCRVVLCWVMPGNGIKSGRRLRDIELLLMNRERVVRIQWEYNEIRRDDSFDRGDEHQPNDSQRFPVSSVLLGRLWSDRHWIDVDPTIIRRCQVNLRIKWISMWIWISPSAVSPSISLLLFVDITLAIPHRIYFHKIKMKNICIMKANNEQTRARK